MSTDEARTEAASALRDLNHVFSAHDPDDDELRAFAVQARELIAMLDTKPRRDRLALMQAAVSERGFPIGNSGSGFSDRAVGGTTNPTGVDITVGYEGNEVVAQVILRKAFEGAPGRAHGGIVAAAFDDVTGFVIGQNGEPAFTGELTVRYVAPVPVERPLEMRARMDGRERRKLFISGECRDGDAVVATCHAIYVTVDRNRFAGFPDPR